MATKLTLVWLLCLSVITLGCGVKKDKTLGTAQLGSEGKATIYATFGRDEAKLGLKVERLSAPASYFMLRFSSYDGFSPFQMRMLYSKSSKRIWIILSEREQTDELSSYSFETGEFVDKHGVLLASSTRANADYPEYRDGKVPPVSDDAVEVMQISHQGD